MIYVVTRQNTDGSFDEVGMNNRATFSHYKTFSGAFRYGIKPFGNGRVCRVEVYANNVQTQPIDSFHVTTN